MLTPGTLLSERYRIERVLGQGGMGAVYKARIEALDGKPVAIKEMSTPGEASAVEQFRKEASFLANLDHPNLVGVTDFFGVGGLYYLVMAYVEGQTLEQKLQARGRPFPVVEVLQWADQLCSVLDYLHSRTPPILFRDLKPSNIMVDPAGRLRLIDFGIARALSPGTATSTFLQGVGSAGYSPIEQYAGGGSTDPRSDLYSLGATLYQVLTGRVPISPVELVSDNRAQPPPRDLNPAIPPWLDSILRRALALRKEQRFGSAREFQAALRQAQGQDLQATGALPAPQAFVPYDAPYGSTAPQAPILGGPPMRTVAQGSTPSPPLYAAGATRAPASGFTPSVPPGPATAPMPSGSGGLWAVAGVLFLALLAGVPFGMKVFSEPAAVVTPSVASPSPEGSRKPVQAPQKLAEIDEVEPPPQADYQVLRPVSTRTVPPHQVPSPKPRRTTDPPGARFPRTSYPTAKRPEPPPPQSAALLTTPPEPEPATSAAPPPPPPSEAPRPPGLPKTLEWPPPNWTPGEPPPPEYEPYMPHHRPGGPGGHEGPPGPGAPSGPGGIPGYDTQR